MFRNENTIVNLPVIEDPNGVPLPLPVDQFPAESFNKNAGGWIASDVTLLMRATTQQEYEMIAARLQEVKKQNPDTSKMSDQEILKTIWHRGAQTPSEIESFMDYYNKVNPVPVNNVDPEQKTINFAENAEAESSKA